MPELIPFLVMFYNVQMGSSHYYYFLLENVLPGKPAQTSLKFSASVPYILGHRRESPSPDSAFPLQKRTYMATSNLC